MSLALDFDIAPYRRPVPGPDLWGATLRLCLCYWCGVFVAASLLWGIVGTDPLESAPGKLVHYGLSAGLTLAIAGLLIRLRAWSLPAKAMLCLLLSVLAAPVFAGLDYLIYWVCVHPAPIAFAWSDLGTVLVYGMSLIFAWSCLFLALLYSFALRAGERSLMQARAVAEEARREAARLACLEGEVADLRAALRRQQEPEPVFWVRQRHGQLRVPAAEVTAIMAERDYVRLVTDRGSHLLSESLSGLEKRFADGTFLRIHRSAMVRRAAIRALRPGALGDLEVLLTDGSVHRVGRTYRRAVRASVLDQGPSPSP